MSEMQLEMNKLVEIGGCIEIPADVETDFVIDNSEKVLDVAFRCGEKHFLLYQVEK